MRRFPLALGFLGIAFVAPACADDYVLGKPDAPITIIEYASLNCPHCKHFEETIFPSLKAAWIDTGKAKYIYRDFPLNENALRASIVARCAPKNHYFAFISALFATQDGWGFQADPLPGLKQVARLGGLSPERVDICLADKSLENAVLAQVQDGVNRYKIDGTPTIIVNDQKLDTPVSYGDLDAAIKKVTGAS